MDGKRGVSAWVCFVVCHFPLTFLWFCTTVQVQETWEKRSVDLWPKRCYFSSPGSVFLTLLQLQLDNSSKIPQGLHGSWGDVLSQRKRFYVGRDEPSDVFHVWVGRTCRGGGVRSIFIRSRGGLVSGCGRGHFSFWRPHFRRRVYF